MAIMKFEQCFVFSSHQKTTLKASYTSLFFRDQMLEFQATSHGALVVLKMKIFTFTTLDVNCF